MITIPGQGKGSTRGKMSVYWYKLLCILTTNQMFNDQKEKCIYKI